MARFEVEFYENEKDELRAKVSSDITRVLYFFYVDKHIILTNGFIIKNAENSFVNANIKIDHFRPFR